LLIPSYIAMMALLAIASIYGSGALAIFFQPRDGAVAERLRQTGRVIDVMTDDNDLAIVVDDYGIMSPILLYFAHLKGWSFEARDVSPVVIDNLRGLGARYFVTTRWSDLKRERPETAAFLEMNLDILNTPEDTRLFDLRQRK
jgi:hypothetical protein